MWRLLRRIGYPPQRPARVAIERDEDEIIERTATPYITLVDVGDLYITPADADGVRGRRLAGLGGGGAVCLDAGGGTARDWTPIADGEFLRAKPDGPAGPRGAAMPTSGSPKLAGPARSCRTWQPARRTSHIS